jgi:hypothetical protein
MRIIKYTRHEPHHEQEDREAPLSTFVYDVPYLGGCGIFPPLHILNQILENGGGDAGMSPSASWEPFYLTENEYDELCGVIEKLDPQSLYESARFCDAKFRLDHDLDHIQDRFAWLKAACDKYREIYFEEQNRNIGT